MRRIAIFARWPAPGRVKTRLSPALPEPFACMLHQAMVADTLATLTASDADERRLFWADAPPDTLTAITPGGVRVEEQVEGDLGQRLAGAFASMLPEPEDRAVAVGTDCSALAPRHFAAAFGALEEHDVVLGPSHDGGYYLIGLRRPLPALFTGIAWGTGRVMEQSLVRARQAEARVATLEPLDDLDTADDLVWLVAQWLARAPGERPPATARALVEMGLLPPS